MYDVVVFFYKSLSVGLFVVSTAWVTLIFLISKVCAIVCSVYTIRYSKCAIYVLSLLIMTNNFIFYATKELKESSEICYGDKQPPYMPF